MKKIILLILDGFGINNSDTGNAIKMANMPVLTKIMEDYSVSELSASGVDVGLPKNQAGNSEAGHMTIGCGRVITQPITLIDSKIKDKSFFENDCLLDLMDYVNDNKSTLHIIGLISDNKVYSSMDHLYACLALAKIRKVSSVVFHFITDSSDSINDNALTSINKFMQKVSKLGLGTLGTICGRYYAMDKDNNYDRIKKSYDVIVHNIGNTFSDYERCLELHYKNNIDDDYINPSVITKGSMIKDGDGVLFTNYRSETLKELITAFTDPAFNMFSTKKFKDIRVVSLYDLNGKVECAYANEPITNTFGSYLAGLDFKQARIAESEKYSHVTYYFDGCEDFNDKNLYKILVPSQNVARYDIRPEMSVGEITQAVLDVIDKDFDFILVNFANPDMVGHSGNIPACVRALEACDFCIGKILEKAEENFYDLVITSDHGNCEYMKDENGNIIRGHTDNKVPFVICNDKYKLKKEGSLCDVVPTITDVYEISRPNEMTGESLIIKNE